jgi:hypothetical protein
MRHWHTPRLNEEVRAVTAVGNDDDDDDDDDDDGALMITVMMLCEGHCRGGKRNLSKVVMT